jgi:CBS domain containing-hemolysin-like protein
MTNLASTSSFIHFIGFLLGFFPLTICIFVLCIKRPKSYGRFVGGIVLIGIAVFNFWVLSMFETVVPLLQEIGSPLFSKMDLMEAKHSAVTWLYVLPAIAAGIGVNLVSSFILRDD